MKRIFFLLIISAIIFSGCTKKEEEKPFELKDVSPYFNAHEKAKDIKNISEERKQEAEEFLK